MKAYQERLITLLKDTITLLCRNGLEYDQQFCVEGLLGVTLDKDKEVFLIPIKELITDKGVGTDDGVGLEAEQEPASDTDADVDSSIVKNEESLSSRKRRRHKHREMVGDRGQEDEGGTNFDTGPAEWNTDTHNPDNTEDSISNQDESSRKRRRHREPVDVKSEDVVVIKEEVDDEEFASAFHDSSMDSSIQNRDGSNLDYFAQPGTSQGQLGFPMDQLQGGGEQGMSASMLGPQEGDGSWLPNPGDISQQPTQAWQPEQKHQDICDLCGKVFSQNWLLQRHLRSVHLKVRHTCYICGNSYYRQDVVKSHIKVKHPGMPLEPSGNIGY